MGCYVVSHNGKWLRILGTSWFSIFISRHFTIGCPSCVEKEGYPSLYSTKKISSVPDFFHYCLFHWHRIYYLHTNYPGSAFVGDTYFIWMLCSLYGPYLFLGLFEKVEICGNGVWQFNGLQPWNEYKSFFWGKNITGRVELTLKSKQWFSLPRSTTLMVPLEDRETVQQILESNLPEQPITIETQWHQPGPVKLTNNIM